MNPDTKKKLRLLDVQIQVNREKKERLKQQFLEAARKHGNFPWLADAVEWYVNNLFADYVWEQRRRIELERIIQEQCPELYPAPAPKETVPMPTQVMKAMAAQDAP